jgi:hypothetical protein
MTTAKKAPTTRSRPAPKAKAAKKVPAPPRVKAKPRPAPKAKVPARPAKPGTRAPQGYGPNVPDLGCQDPTLGQIVDLRHCEVPPGKKRKKCSTVRSVVVGCAEPSADKPRRKQMYVVPEGRRYIVPQAEVRKELRAGARARTRLDLPERDCEDYAAARAKGIRVSTDAYDGNECSRFVEPEPVAFAPRADDPWEQVAAPVVVPEPVRVVASDLSTDPRLERWVREYMTQGYASAYDAQEALDSLTRLSGSVVFARAMVAGWTALLRHTPNPSENDLVGLIRDAYAEARSAKANGSAGRRGVRRRVHTAAVKAAESKAANQRLQRAWAKVDTADRLDMRLGTPATAAALAAAQAEHAVAYEAVQRAFAEEDRATDRAWPPNSRPAKLAKSNGRHAAAHGDLPPLAAWRLDKHGHTVTAPGTTWPNTVTFSIGPVYGRGGVRAVPVGYAVGVVGARVGFHDLVTPAGEIVLNAPLQSHHLVRSPQAGLTAARKAWASLRKAKSNDAHKAASPRGVALRDSGKDPLIGRRVGGEDFTGFVRAPAVGCDGKKAYLVGGEVEPRSKVLAAIRKAEIDAGLRPPPPPRKGARPSSPVRSAAPPPFRAPLGLPAPGQTSHQASATEHFGPGSADAVRRPWRPEDPKQWLRDYASGYVVERAYVVDAQGNRSAVPGQFHLFGSVDPWRNPSRPKATLSREQVEQLLPSWERNMSKRSKDAAGALIPQDLDGVERSGVIGGHVVSIRGQVIEKGGRLVVNVHAVSPPVGRMRDRQRLLAAGTPPLDSTWRVTGDPQRVRELLAEDAAGSRLGFGPGSPDLRRPRPSAADVADRVAAERSAEDWARAEVGNVVEFQATRRDGKVETRENKLRGVVLRRHPTDVHGEGLDLYALQVWDRDEHQWITRERQDSLTLRAYMGRLEIVAGAEPRAREVVGMMEAFHRLQAAYAAAGRTLALRESTFAESPAPEAGDDLDRYAARLREMTGAAPGAAPVSRVDAGERRPLPPRVGLVETRDPSPAWDVGQVGDAVVFRPRATNQVKMRGRIAAIVVKADGRTREGIALDHAERFEANRWKSVPVTERFILYNTKGSLEITKAASVAAAPRTPASSEDWRSTARGGVLPPPIAPKPAYAGDDVALMQQFEMLREGLSFYGLEGKAPTAEYFAAFNRLQAEDKLREMQARIDRERATVQQAPANDVPDFGAFITGVKPNDSAARGGHTLQDLVQAHRLDTAVHAALAARVRAGHYSHEAGVAAYKPVVDAAAVIYQRQARDGATRVFRNDLRWAVAHGLADRFEQQLGAKPNGRARVYGPGVRRR